jgi:hypothetical protein
MSSKYPLIELQTAVMASGCQLLSIIDHCRLIQVLVSTPTGHDLGVKDTKSWGILASYQLGELRIEILLLA